MGKNVENSCIINKTKKMINASGNAYEFKNLIVQGQTMEETKKVFDEEWKDD